MTRLIFFLKQYFEYELKKSGLWPRISEAELVKILDWYSSKLRPFLHELYGVMVAICEAGLTQSTLSSGDAKTEKLKRLHSHYIDRFILMCDQIEQNFFVDGNTFLFGEEISAVDYVVYQELLSAMILTGQGNQHEFFKSDSRAKLRLQNVVQWYEQMANDKYC